MRVGYAYKLSRKDVGGRRCAMPGGCSLTAAVGERYALGGHCFFYELLHKLQISKIANQKN